MATIRHLHMEPMLPEGRFAVLATCWDLRRGEHPHLAGLLPELPTKPAFPSAEQWSELARLELPLMPGTQGHHMMRDATYLAACGGVDEWPLAPLFVKDLAGRIIHTGLSPLPTPPASPVFPAGCEVLSADVPMASLVENVIFTAFRRLEISPCKGVGMSGQPGLGLRGAYPHPATVPYKLRPDTFYQDGWRVPQVARLFCRKVAEEEAQARAREFMAKWHARPEGQDYETFFDTNGGQEWFNGLFEQGMTVIPTLEAYNGRYHVDENYVATDVDPGRAVAGLHQVVRVEASELPAQTILEVLQPGFVTATQIFPAQVVVSDGSGFHAPSAPEPLLPDLRLPHPRVGGSWGAVWLPTHPEHFAEPALWDWNASGHFVQISGPLWDPVHYTYASTQAIIRAARKPVPENPGAFQLPESLRHRFHPVVAPTWYDTVNERTAQEREGQAEHPLAGSVLDSLPLGVTVASLGYHRLPLGLEYEMDPAVFPYMFVSQKVEGEAEPPAERIAPVSEILAPSGQLARHHVVVSEPLRRLMAQAEAAGPEATVPVKVGQAMQPQGAPVWLVEVPASQLLVNVKRLFANREYRQVLYQHSPTMAGALFRFRESALALRRLRHRLFGKYPAVWVHAWVNGLDITTAEGLVAQLEANLHQQVDQSRRKSLGVEEVFQKPMPAKVAGRLRFRSGASKLQTTQP